MAETLFGSLRDGFQSVLGSVTSKLLYLPKPRNSTKRHENNENNEKIDLDEQFLDENA
jgi:hypothetical protein